MWHEARKQERKIRGMLVDYRKRAERRRDFYEKIKADPTQFLQIHGRQCKIHLDPSIAAAADSAVMMPWQGQTDNLIDRFDVRAHLDYIPPVKKEEETEIAQEERHLNYERYRIIAQNAFLGISEEKFLKQLHLEEQFGYTEMKGKREQKSSGAAIGFNYEDGIGVNQPTMLDGTEENSDDDNSDSDLDVDLAINVSKIDSLQAHEMNKHGRSFGMMGNDFYSFLTNDLEEAETYRLAKEEEHEKALFSGRKSRRERRAHREKRLANRVISPPSYAARESPTYPPIRDESKSPSRSPSPDNTGKITYITSFGDDEEMPSSSKPTYADKVRFGKSKKKETSAERFVYFGRRRSRSRSREVTYAKKRRRSRSTSRSRRSNSRSRTSHSRSKRSRSRPRRSRSKSRRSWSKSKRSRSRSRQSRSKSKRSRSKSKERYTSFSKTVRSYKRCSMSSSSSNRSRSKSLPLQSASPKEIRKSKSPSVKKESPPKVIPRYYGRKKSDQSSSEMSDSGDEGIKDVEMKPVFNPVPGDSKLGHGNNSGTAIKKTASSLTVIERLKRKRQALLNKQFKKDKIAEELKAEREKQEQQTREDELREMAIKLRRRQREKRHAYDSNRSSSSDVDRSRSPSSSENKEKSESPVRSREREPKRSDRYDRRGKRPSRERDRTKDRRSRSRDRDNRWDRSKRDRDKRSSSATRKYKDRDEKDKKREEVDKREERERRLVDY